VTEFPFDVVPGQPAVTVHVVASDSVRDALVAQRVDQPIEYRRRVAIGDPFSHPVGLELGSNVIDQARGSGKTADPVDKPGSVIDCSSPPPVANSCRTLALGLAMLAGPGRSHRHQIIETNLRWASLSPSMYRWVVWIDR
jgi:hypothetical protein